jgi:hypothetical protein
MGEKALFIEHPTNKSNKAIKLISDLYWADINKLPYSITGSIFKHYLMIGLS